MNLTVPKKACVSLEHLPAKTKFGIAAATLVGAAATGYLIYRRLHDQCKEEAKANGEHSKTWAPVDEEC